MAKVSIIIPVFNMAHLLEEGLNSIRNQTLEDIEIICINDCSTDNSLDILYKYQKQDPRFVIINLEQNKGTGYARNIGIENATADYIMFFDPDDLYVKEACEKAYNKIRQNDDDIVFFNFDCFNHNGFYKSYFREYNEMLPSEIVSKNIYNNNIPYMGCCWSKIYKRNFLIENNCRFTETVVSEDRPFAVITTLKAKKISLLNEVLYHYRREQADNKRKKLLQKRTWQQNIYNLEKMYEYILENNVDSYFSISTINNIIKFSLYEMTNFIKQYKKDREEIYERIRNFLLKVQEHYDYNILEEKVKIKFDYIKYCDILKSKAYRTYCINNFLSKIFCIKKTNRKIFIQILGIKICKNLKIK